MHCISDLHVCSNPCSFQFPSLFLHFYTLLSFISLNPKTQLQNWKRYETLCYDKRIECGGSVNQGCAHAVTRNAETILAEDKSMKSAKFTCKFRNVRGRKAGARKACKSALISTSPTLAWNFMTTQYVNNNHQPNYTEKLQRTSSWQPVDAYVTGCPSNIEIDFWKHG